MSCQASVLHCGPDQPRIETEVLGHSFVSSLIRSLVHFAHSLAHGTVNDWMAIYSVFFFLHFGPSDPPGVIILNVLGGKKCDVFMEPGGIFEISVLDVKSTETQTVRMGKEKKRRWK